jgi:hypothetical protein
LNRQGIFDRDLFFGDASLETAARRGATVEPWRSFEKARAFVSEGKLPQARETLESIALLKGLESRIRLQAWHSLREVGGQPPSTIENDLLGVVVEVGMPEGQDLLAVYSDQTVHYYNYSGRAAIWLRPDASLDGQINSVLAAAGVILPQIGPWNESRRPPPSAGIARLNILTPLGLHFGEAPLQVLDRDPSSRPLLRAATAVMARLTSLSRG